MAIEMPQIRKDLGVGEVSSLGIARAEYLSTRKLLTLFIQELYIIFPAGTQYLHKPDILKYFCHMDTGGWLGRNTQTPAWPLDRRTACEINSYEMLLGEACQPAGRSACTVTAPGTAAYVTLQTVYRYHPIYGWSCSRVWGGPKEQ